MSEGQQRPQAPRTRVCYKTVLSPGNSGFASPATCSNLHDLPLVFFFSVSGQLSPGGDHVSSPFDHTFSYATPCPHVVRTAEALAKKCSNSCRRVKRKGAPFQPRVTKIFVSRVASDDRDAPAKNNTPRREPNLCVVDHSACHHQRTQRLTTVTK